MVFTDKSLEECLDEIEFDRGKLIKIKRSKYEKKHLKMFTGEEPGEYIDINPITVLSPRYYKEIHRRILNGECLEVNYHQILSLDGYFKGIRDVAFISLMFLDNPPRRERDIDVYFFSEVFSNSIEWGGEDLEFNIWVSNKGSVIAIKQENEWDYKKYIENFKKGIAKPKGGGAGMTVIAKAPYEVGYTDNGRTTYVLIKKV
ncbi:MAG: hypothetical protein J7K22_02460 [Nanoarchaeota archaeon]|nr:hypothetical protein [Nanoarchaeota archaeon]